MTTTGLTLHFLRDDDGQPRVLFLRDRLGVCPVCGHELIERVYDDVSYHHLTVARFRALAAEAPEGFAHSCEQCGEALGADSVKRWALTYGFPQEAGLLQAFGSRNDAGEFALVYALSPHRALDAQMLPEWSAPDDQSVRVFTELTESHVYVAMGRHLNLKAGWRRLLRGRFERPDPDGVVVVELARGYEAALGPSEAAIARALRRGWDDDDEELGAGAVAERVVVTASLADPINLLVDNGPGEWLPEEWQRRLEGGAPVAVAVGDVGVAAQLLHEALARLPVTARCVIDEDWEAEVVFPVGGAEVERYSVSLRALLLEALVTGSAPADWIGLWLDERLVEVTTSGGGGDRG